MLTDEDKVAKNIDMYHSAVTTILIKVNLPVHEVFLILFQMKLSFVQVLAIQSNASFSNLDASLQTQVFESRKPQRLQFTHVLSEAARQG